MRPLLLFLLPLLIAATYTDTLDGDFNAGTLQEIEVTSNSVVLNSTLGVYAASGTYTSRVFDLGSNPSATISWNMATPAGTSLLLSTRSGPNSTDFSGWSAWSSDYGSSGSAVSSPTNRYYQYRAQLITLNGAWSPVLTDLTLDATEANTTITKIATTNLTGNTSGSYEFRVFVNDTYTILNVSARYSIGGGAYSTSLPMGSLGSAVYNLTVPDPGWYPYRDTNLTLEVTATRTNGSATSTVTDTVDELIDFVNTAPTLDPVSNYTISQGQAVNFTATATDTDGQLLTFTTNGTNITITQLTNSSARITWVPTALQTGVHALRLTVSDGIASSSRNFTVNVTDTNDAPLLSSVAAITGYHGVRMAVILTAYDPDANANLTFSVSPAHFSVVTSTTGGNSSGQGYYYGIANFTPADPERGTHNLTFTVSDGIASTNANTTMTINYCGDGTCQSGYEDSASCAADCTAPVTLQSIALVVPDRNCANASMEIIAFDATDRFSCYYQGLVEQGLALCSPLPSTSIAVYERNGTHLNSITTLSTDSYGYADFTPPRPGEYKFTATKTDYANTSAIVYVRSCENDIVIEENNFTVEQPPLPPPNEGKKPQPPEEQEPLDLQEEASLLQATLFYVVVPMLLAMLLYAGNVFYDVNKDSLPVLLELRIAVNEQRIRYRPQIEQAKAKAKPFVEPVVQSLSALYGATLKPLVDRLRRK